MAKRPTIDYEPLRIEYVNSEITIRELCEKHGVSESAVEAKCYRDDWSEQRRKLQADVLQRVNEKLTDKRVQELSEWNDNDLKVAKALRAKAVNYLTNPEHKLSPMELRALATTLDSAQKIGRLALGVSTNSSEITGKDGQALMKSLELVFVE